MLNLVHRNTVQYNNYLEANKAVHLWVPMLVVAVVYYSATYCFKRWTDPLSVTYLPTSIAESGEDDEGMRHQL